jgi:hypothetical protein
LLCSKKKHVILVQNCFRYSDGLYDIDYTAVPVPWTTNATVIAKAHVNKEEAKILLSSFTINEKTKKRTYIKTTKRDFILFSF